MNRHRSHLRGTTALSMLACFALSSLDANAADFVLKETSADKLVCRKVEGDLDCQVENSGRYTLDIKVSKQDFDDNNIRFREFNECSPIGINIGRLDFDSRFCDADKWPVYPWQDLNTKWSMVQPRCKKFDADGACLKEQAFVYRTIAAKILKTGGMLLKINGIYAEDLGDSVLKNDCLGGGSDDPLPTQLTLMVVDKYLSIDGQVVCNSKTSTITKGDQSFELTKMAITTSKKKND